MRRQAVLFLVLALTAGGLAAVLASRMLRTPPAEVVGRGLLAPVRANEPLLSTKLANAELGGGMTIIIPEGERAMSVRVDDVVGVAGFVLPGTRVDVLVTIDRTKTSVKFKNDQHLLQVIDRIVSAVGRRIDESSPIVGYPLRP